MATPASWAREVPAVNSNASFEVEDSTSGKIALDTQRTLRQRITPHYR